MLILLLHLDLMNWTCAMFSHRIFYLSTRRVDSGNIPQCHLSSAAIHVPLIVLISFVGAMEILWSLAHAFQWVRRVVGAGIGRRGHSLHNGITRMFELHWRLTTIKKNRMECVSREIFVGTYHRGVWRVVKFIRTSWGIQSSAICNGQRKCNC